MRPSLLLPLACLTAACASPLSPDPEGRWGSPDATLTLRREGGTITYGCGHGVIDAGWTVDRRGAFEATGTHVFGGGPDPVGGRPEYPARYEGRVAGSRFTLTVTTALSEGAGVLGPFTLTRDGPSIVERCL